MAADILAKYGNGVKALTLIPSSGGAYTITKDGREIFSKKKLGRFPHSNQEILELLEK